MIEAALLIPAFAVLNRLRGTSEWREHLGWPGRSLYYVTGAAFLLLLAVYPTQWFNAIAFSASYLAWGSLPWGRWYGLGRVTEEWKPDRKATWFEQLVENVSDNIHVRFFVRNLFAFSPLFLLVPFNWALFPPLTAAVQTGLYELGYRITPEKGTVTGEYFTGAFWGLLAIVVFGYV